MLQGRKNIPGLIGSGLCFIGVFVPLVKVSVWAIERTTAFIDGPDGVFVLIVSILGILLSLSTKTAPLVVTSILGGINLWILEYDVTAYKERVTDSDITVINGSGFYLITIGAIMMIAGLIYYTVVDLTQKKPGGGTPVTGGQRDVTQIPADYQQDVQQIRTQQVSPKRESAISRVIDNVEDKLVILWDAAVDGIKRRKSTIIKVLIGLAIYVAIFVVLFVVSNILVPMYHYNKGMNYMDSGEYELAINEFDRSTGYKDSDEQYDMATVRYHYQCGELAFDSGDYMQANKEFLKADSYSDSDERASISLLAYHNAQGDSLFDAGDFPGAVEEYILADGYDDSEARINESKYLYACGVMDSGDYMGAYLLFGELGKYRDSMEKIYDCGMAFFDAEDYENAFLILSDCSENGASAYASYAYGVLRFDEGSYDAAAQSFGAAGEILDAGERQNESIYQRAMQVFDAGDYTGARMRFFGLGGYSDSAHMVKVCDFMQAEDDYHIGDLASAQARYEALPEDFSYGGVSVAERLQTLEEHSEYVDMCGLWSLSGGFLSSEERTSYSRHNWNVSFEEADFYDVLVIVCTINDDGSVDISGITLMPVLTNYSSIKSLLDIEGIELDFTIPNATSIPSNVEIYDYTTLTYSNGSFNINYCRVDYPNTWATDTMTTDMVFTRAE